MLQKLNAKRAGFTLVEIMVVVSIIALIAAIAVPNALRARKRSQATSSLQTLRMLDSAKEQYAIDNNKAGTVTPTGPELQPYVKKDTKLYTQLATAAITVYDDIGGLIIAGNLDTPPKVATTTRTALDPVLGSTAADRDNFWGAYK
jgi:prepilin-type N-terminal cleavage/methylation domain-containing protein